MNHLSLTQTPIQFGINPTLCSRAKTQNSLQNVPMFSGMEDEGFDTVQFSGQPKVQFGNNTDKIEIKTPEEFYQKLQGLEKLGRESTEAEREQEIETVAAIVKYLVKPDNGLHYEVEYSAKDDNPFECRGRISFFEDPKTQEDNTKPLHTIPNLSILYDYEYNCFGINDEYKYPSTITILNQQYPEEIKPAYSTVSANEFFNILNDDTYHPHEDWGTRIAQSVRLFAKEHHEKQLKRNH